MGVVKITPAHDPNDYEVGMRHDLPRIKVINPDATMNENAGIYCGLSREECRKKLVKDLEEAGILISIEEITHSVGHSERSDAIVEPYLSRQWFVKMRPLADRVLENQKSKDTKVNFVPDRFEKIMNHWMEITYDWCISRQIWWGHRIPVWYKGEEVYCGMEAPNEEGWVQDPDVLDTWFSSALWPFSSLGFPEETNDLKDYYPNNILVTGYDIIPFWVNRMTFQGLHFTGQRPFKECLIHGLIRDKEGRKMSKSLGNGIDPMDAIHDYGNDALRFFLTTTTAPGMDLRYDEEKVKSCWNFINKLWNASRFCLMNMEDFTKEQFSLDNLKDIDKWILTKLNKTINEVRQNMDKYEFNNVGSTLYSFIWDDFCDNYIEMAKFSLNETNTKSTLYHVILNIIKLLHPFMPYVTEEIYQKLPFHDCESIMIDSYPKVNEEMLFTEDEQNIDKLIEFCNMFRGTKKEHNMTNEYKVKINEAYNIELVSKILKLVDHLTEEELQITKFNVSNSLYNMDLFYEKQITEEDIKAKEKLIETLKSNIERRTKLLNNPGYMSKAPKHLIEEEQRKVEEEKAELEKLLNE